MADAVNTESVQPTPELQPKGSSKAKEFVSWLKRFGKKHEKSEPRVSVQDPIQNSETSEAQPQKSVNELLGVKEADQLKPGEALFFHTTPSKNVEPIKANGLYSKASDPDLGSNIGYSAFFATEHRLRSKNVVISTEDARERTPSEYSLTIWNDGGPLAKDKQFAQYRFYAPREKPEDGKDLTEYLDAAYKDGDEYYRSLGEIMGKILKRENNVHLSNEFLLGVINLGKDVRDSIIKNMVLAETGRVSADQVEGNFLNLLSQHLSFSKAGVSTQDLAHNLTASVEHNLIRTGIMEKIKDIKQDATPKAKAIDDCLFSAMYLRSQVNDRASAKYLDLVIKQLTGKLDEAGLDSAQVIDDNVVKVKSLKGNRATFQSTVNARDLSKYYGSDHVTKVAQQIKEELKI